MSNFNLLNDNELIYFYKIGNQKPIELIIKKYHYDIKMVKYKILKKFYNIPFGNDDFDSYIYFWTKEAMLNYKNKFNKKFKNYLFLLIKWNMLNLISKFLNKNHSILNNAFNNIEIVKNQIVFDNNLNNFEKNKNFLYYILNSLNLTMLEKNILLHRINGKSNSEILKITNYTYKQLDNAFQRSIKKIRLTLNGVDYY